MPTANIIFVNKSFSQLTVHELYSTLQLRAEIFVVEQNCVYNDLDSLDQDGYHLMVKQNDEIIAYARLLMPNSRFQEYSIGRLVVRRSFRGKELGIQTMKEAIRVLNRDFRAKKIKISAQKYLQDFYEGLGFKVVTDEYLEDGIPHLGMMWELGEER